MESLAGFGSPRVALLGDFMLDRYVYGDVERISPEAPVPVLKVVRTELRAGGAGNVASAVLALGGKVACIGVRGSDPEGEDLANLLVSAGAETHTLLRLPPWRTIIKTRYVGLAQHRNEQQTLRVDHDPTGPIPANVQVSLLSAVRGEARSCGVLAIQDHDKGLVTDETGPSLIAAGVEAGAKVMVDPARTRDYRRYVGATVLMPNRYEATMATGIAITDDASLAAAAKRILDVTGAEAVLVTLDREGSFLLTRGGARQRFGTRSRAVSDVTGAGDEVLAMVCLAVAAGCDYERAVQLANVAGGLEVERFGVVPIRRQEVMEELRRMAGLRGRKVVSRGELVEEVARMRQRGGRVVFTNGCFDLLHMGHVRYLQQARELGSCLIVAINSDGSVRRLKGPSRPIIGAEERADMLGSLECVDYVTIFDEDTPIALLELLRPDVLAKGGTTAQVVGRELVEGYGGTVLTLDEISGLSTTQIIERIVEAHGERSAPAPRA
ncbi:MAG TPA: D-glycero-beta-D-manno-heptose 1-phosphate adenylyltransferase [Phycisphaerae bacterium]|nr:D-glycero-beta-D-manno-heptose 1-phosphate adenylyltransferase [Phycisphaerae bacterium]